MLCFGLAVPVFASEIKVIVNGAELSFDQPPIIEDGRTLVPLRIIFEALGAEVDWEQTTQTITATKDDITITLRIGSDILVKSGEEIKLDVPPKIISNRTLVPARAVAESFGAEVVWDQTAMTVKIDTSSSGIDNQIKNLNQDEFLIIPINVISETVSFFPVMVDNILMEILVVEASDGTIRTSYNTCENCHKSGKGYYEQEGDEVICQQCKMRFKIDSIGLQSGGCQPIPIFDEDKTVTNDAIQISYEVLSDNTHWFLNWKPLLND